MVSLLGRAALAAALFATLGGAAAAQERGADFRIEALERQPLYPGECGLFLWSRAERPLLVFVAVDDPAEAKMRVQDRNRTLRRTAFSGQPSYGHFEQQTYTGDRLTVAVEVEFDADRPVRDGAVVKGGVLRVQDEQGWETMLPVGGLVACKAQE